MFGEISDARSANRQPFGAEEPSLELEVAAKSSELSVGGYDAVAGDVALAAVAHDVADRAGGSGPSSRFSDVAVGGHLADGNATNDAQHGVGKCGHGQFTNSDFTNSECDADADARLQAACLDRERASLRGFQIDVRPCVTNQAADTNRLHEHPGHVDAGVEADG